MVVDVSGVMLTPGNLGKDCLGNGECDGVECCCDECDYMMCCVETHQEEECLVCVDKECPRRWIVQSR